MKEMQEWETENFRLITGWVVSWETLGYKIFTFKLMDKSEITFNIKL